MFLGFSALISQRYSTDLQKYKKNDTNEDFRMKHHRNVIYSAAQGIQRVSFTEK